ncbi:ADP-ribosylation factor GTPase-activating protein 1 isoform X2 [Cimex lectularius]|nr:ADP-ribosylation factor GTPase-activating protein 1 isoform X2 [Cimex lectularius]
MDKWKDIELEKMKVGGNRKAREFFDGQDDWDETLPIQNKYNTKAAALYRDKISTLANGKEWSPTTAKVDSFNSYKFKSDNYQQNDSCQSYQDMTENSSYNNGGSYQNYQNYNSHEFKDEKEAFFHRKQQENLKRPSDLPPNQGGKYSGFGYTMDPPPRSSSQEFFDTAVSSLSSFGQSGWSLFSKSALKIANKTTESAFKIGSIASQKVAEIGVTVTDKVKEGKILEEVGNQVSELANKVGDLGRKGWQDIAGSNIPSAQSPVSPSGSTTEKSSLLYETISSPTPQNLQKSHNDTLKTEWDSWKDKECSTKSARTNEWESSLEDEAWHSLNKS